MSDMAPQFFNAWSVVNGALARWRICKWHVEKAWVSNMSSKIKIDSNYEVVVDKEKIKRDLKETWFITDPAEFREKWAIVVGGLINEPQTQAYGINCGTTTQPEWKNGKPIFVQWVYMIQIWHRRSSIST